MVSFLQSSLIRSSIKLSDILKNKFSVSIITWSIGIKLNNGLVLKLYCLDFVYLPISCESLAPRDLSVIDHFLLMSNLSFLGHLHQIQAKFWFAALDHKHRLEISSFFPKNAQCYTYDYLQLFLSNLTSHYLDQQGFI